MDELNLITRMRSLRKRYRFTANEQALFYELLAMFRSQGKSAIFYCSNNELCAILHLPKNTYIKARKILISAGLIFYKSGKGKRTVSQFSFVKSFSDDTEKGTDASTAKGTNKLNTDADCEQSEQFNKPRSKPFTPPTFEEVEAYCLERNNGINPQSFIDHYAANGWMRGKTKIKDWKACIRTWEQNKKANENRTDNTKPKDYTKGF